VAERIGELFELFFILYSIPLLFSFATAIKFRSAYKNLAIKRSWLLNLIFPLDISFDQHFKMVMPFTLLSGEGAKTRIAASVIQVLCMVLPFVLPFIINSLN
jgi:hypothetical protein